MWNSYLATWASSSLHIKYLTELKRTVPLSVWIPGCLLVLFLCFMLLLFVLFCLPISERTVVFILYYLGDLFSSRSEREFLE